MIFRLAGPDLAPTLDETLGLDLAAGASEQAKTAFLGGLHIAIGIATVLSTALGVLALRWIPKSKI